MTLRTDNCEIKFILYRVDPLILNHEFGKSVRVLYVVCKDDHSNGEFQSEDMNSNKLENALNRIDLGVKLLQTFISEVLFRKFQIRKTFSLRNDLTKNEDNVCEVFYTTLSKKSALEMSPNELFLALATEIKQTDFNKDCKYLAILSFTRFEQNPLQNETDIFKQTKGYCALGDLTRFI